MPTNLKEKIDALDPARKAKVEARANELIAEEKARNAVKEALVVFTNVMSASGPRVRASVFCEGTTKAATSTMTAKGITKLREWARKQVAADVKLAEMVNVSAKGVFPTGLEGKLIQESQTIVLEPNDAMAKKLAHASFPEYTGRKFKVQVVPEGTNIDVTSYWDGGSRDYFVVMNLVTMKSMPVPQNGDPYTRKIAPVKIHENMCVVQHSIFMGKDTGLTFIISEKNAAQLLPSNDVNLDKKEKTVLVLLRSLKPAYRRDEARHAGISNQEYDTIIANLKVKQYVNSSGAITPKGRNAINGIRDLYQLRNESVNGGLLEGPSLFKTSRPKGKDAHPTVKPWRAKTMKLGQDHAKMMVDIENKEMDAAKKRKANPKDPSLKTLTHEIEQLKAKAAELWKQHHDALEKWKDAKSKVTEEAAFCDACDRVHDGPCPGVELDAQSEPMQEVTLTESTLAQKISSNAGFAAYVAYLTLSGYKFLRYGAGSKMTADFNISGVGDLYIEGSNWEIQGHIKGQRINPTGNSLETLDRFLTDNNI